MTHHTPPEGRGRAGGWFQAGNLGGSGIGGGLGLWLASNLPAPWMGGAVLAGLLALCAAPLAWVPDVPRDQHGNGVFAAVTGTFVDLKELVLSRDGFLAALICFLPIGTGAATGVMAQAEVAARWGAGEAEVVGRHDEWSVEVVAEGQGGGEVEGVERLQRHREGFGRTTENGAVQLDALAPLEEREEGTDARSVVVRCELTQDAQAVEDAETLDLRETTGPGRRRSLRRSGNARCSARQWSGSPPQARQCRKTSHGRRGTPARSPRPQARPRAGAA
jgi:hypothetical protein